jgi:DNA-binding NtrC family response regulator
MKPKLNVLIVDDDQRMTHTLADILRLAEYRVVEAASATTAIEKVRSQPFDCVLTDIRMPEMNGVELHRQLREIKPGLPVVLMTAYAANTLTSEGLENGAVGILDKPLNINHLLAFLGSLARERSIVIVDDDKVFCDTLEGILYQCGFTVSQVNNPHVRVEKITNDAQVILLDLKFNGIDGLDILKEIRKNNPSLPVVLVTGHREEMENILQSAMKIEVFTCLYKPLEIPRLLQTLSEFQTEHLRKLFNRELPRAD